MKLISNPKECGHRHYLENGQWPTCTERILCHNPKRSNGDIMFCKDTKTFSKHCPLKDSKPNKTPIVKRRSRKKCVYYNVRLDSCELTFDTTKCAGVNCGMYNGKVKRNIKKDAPRNLQDQSK